MSVQNPFNSGKFPIVTFALLDYNRPSESEMCLESIKKFVKFEHEILYVSNGGEQDHALKWFKEGKIDRLILNRNNDGCGIATRQCIQSVVTKYVIYVQTDQLLFNDFLEVDLANCINILESNKNIFYIDLAGNQGNGNPSERAFLIERDRYLAIPGIDEIIGGPGKFADHRWGENLLQEYMKNEGLQFLSVKPLLFQDNGKTSRRTYVCGAETMHFTDEKKLFILKPFKQRYDGFPNLNLTDAEWDKVLKGEWRNGDIPEKDLAHSFRVWN